jgi:hypothetical protein
LATKSKKSRLKEAGMNGLEETQTQTKKRGLLHVPKEQKKEDKRKLNCSNSKELTPKCEES